jgi:hypothetical protein
MKQYFVARCSARVVVEMLLILYWMLYSLKATRRGLSISSMGALEPVYVLPVREVEEGVPKELMEGHLISLEGLVWLFLAVNWVGMVSFLLH